MGHRLKKENLLASIRSHSMDILLQTSQHLQFANTYQEIANETCYQINKMLNRAIIFYPVKNNELLEAIFYGLQVNKDIQEQFL